MSLVTPPRKKAVSWFKLFLRASCIIYFFHQLSSVRALSSLAGTLVFLAIAFHDNPVHAQLLRMTETDKLNSQNLPRKMPIQKANFF